MIKQRTINLIFIGILFFILNGCSDPKPKTIIVDNNKKDARGLETKKGIYLSDIEYNDIGYDISIKAPKVFHEDDNISLTVDTKRRVGYIYFLYIDSTGTVELLYPNRFSPLVELSGIYTFPRDFGMMTIKATKDCTDCKEENTKSYIFFSKKLILDIDKITASQLLNIPTNRPTSKAICYPEKKKYDLNFCVVSFVVR